MYCFNILHSLFSYMNKNRFCLLVMCNSYQMSCMSLSVPATLRVFPQNIIYNQKAFFLGTAVFLNRIRIFSGIIGFCSVGLKDLARARFESETYCMEDESRSTEQKVRSIVFASLSYFIL